MIVVDFDIYFNKKIDDESEVTWRFDDLMSSLSNVKCEEINISIYTEIEV